MSAKHSTPKPAAALDSVPDSDRKITKSYHKSHKRAFGECAAVILEKLEFMALHNMGVVDSDGKRWIAYSIRQAVRDLDYSFDAINAALSKLEGKHVLYKQLDVNPARPALYWIDTNCLNELIRTDQESTRQATERLAIGATKANRTDHDKKRNRQKTRLRRSPKPDHADVILNRITTRSGTGSRRDPDQDQSLITTQHDLSQAPDGVVEKPKQMQQKGMSPALELSTDFLACISGYVRPSLAFDADNKQVCAVAVALVERASKVVNKPAHEVNQANLVPFVDQVWRNFASGFKDGATPKLTDPAKWCDRLEVELNAASERQRKAAQRDAEGYKHGRVNDPEAHGEYDYRERDGVVEYFDGGHWILREKKRQWWEDYSNSEEYKSYDDPLGLRQLRQQVESGESTRATVEAIPTIPAF